MTRTWLLLTLATLFAMTGCSRPVDQTTESAALLELHERVLEAHRSGDVDDWISIESDDYVSANGGTISFPTSEERRSVRAPYLAAATFSVYRDLRTPVVHVSNDGTLGWVIVEVEVQGTQLVDGVGEPIDAIWAWIELYEKRAGEWFLIGNVSNRRPS